MRLLDLIVYVDAHQELQASISAACMAATGLLTVAPFAIRRASGNLFFLRKPWLFMLVLSVSLFTCRYPAFFCRSYINPDEPQRLAEAITYESHPIPWRDIDGNTSGPINSYVLLWCLLFGLQPTYLTDRILELFCVLGMLIFLYHAGRQVAGDVAARLALMPVFLFVCWTSSPGFVYYSSEEVSIFLIGLAVYLITKLNRKPGHVYFLVLLGLVLGLLPFAKLQSLMLGVFLGLTAIAILMSKQSGNKHSTFFRILTLIVAALVPAFLILVIVAQAGALNDFWVSYIRNAQSYSVHTPSFGEEMKSRFKLIVWVLRPSGEVAIPLYLSGVSTAMLCLHVLSGSQKTTRSAKLWLIWAVLFAFVSLVTVFFPGRMYSHYQFFLFPAMTFLLIANFRILGLGRHRTALSSSSITLLAAVMLSSLLITVKLFLSDSARLSFVMMGLISLLLVLTIGWLIRQSILSWERLSNWQGRLAWIFIIPFFIVPALIQSVQPNQFRGKIKMYLAEPLSDMDQAIIRDRPFGGRIAIWGWAPEFAAETQTPLGTRDSIAPCAPPPTLQDYYRERFLRDMQNNRPELFLEAIGPDNFAFHDPKLFGIETFPELKELISEQYRLDQEINGMRLFMRRDLAPSESRQNRTTL